MSTESFDPADEDYSTPEPVRDPQANSVFDDLLDQLDEAQAEGWRPSTGDKITGVVLERTKSSPGQWGSYPIFTLRMPDGSKIAVHAFHTVLRNELERLAVMNGDTVGIKYEGVVKGDVQEYESYRVALRRSKENAAIITKMQAAKAV